MIKQALSFLFLFLVLSGSAIAATQTGLPWEGPLETIKNSLTGPIAFYISLIAIAITGSVLAFGGNLEGFAQKAVYLALGISVTVFASNLLSSAFNMNGAIIP
jgi:type IV secretion system protein VirB2